MSRHVEPWLSTVTSDVALDSSISITAKAVYLVLACYRDHHTSTCFPSNETVARSLGCSVATVKRSVSELIAAGVVKRQPRYVEGRQTTSLTRLTDARAHRWGHQ